MSTEGTLMTAEANGDSTSEVAAAGADTQAATTNSTEGADTQPGDGASTDAGNDTLGGEESTSGEDSLSGAPDSYADFARPEGVELDTEVLDDFKATAKELNLPQEAAQRVVDLGIALIQKASDANAAMIAEAQKSWTDASKADPEFGGDKLNESLGLARKGLEAVGTPALKELLEQSGLGNHPEVIRAFRKIGQSHSEDTIVSGNGTDGKPDASPAKRMYPSMA